MDDNKNDNNNKNNVILLNTKYDDVEDVSFFFKSFLIKILDANKRNHS